MSKLVIGVDEAGYGPSMGPLVISATAWRIPDDCSVSEMGSSLEPEIKSLPFRPGLCHVPIGDSKKIYRELHARDGLSLGARFLCAAIRLGHIRHWEELIAYLAPDDWMRLVQVPWYDTQLKHELFRSDSNVELCFEDAFSKLQRCGYELLGMRQRVLDEPEFNRQVDLTGNKASILSELSIKLVRELAIQVSQPNEAIEIYCDKHGGRNRYQSVLTHCFDQVWFSIGVEGRERSSYSCVWNEHPLQIQFNVGGDSLFPSAAASIVAKWTREQLMMRLNSFWIEKVGQALQPTAGYYVDAVRFANEIETVASQLQIPRASWWRKK